MDAKPAPEPDAAPSASSAPEAGAGDGGESERFGEVELRRLRKPDGRALLVYRRAAGE